MSHTVNKVVLAYSGGLDTSVILKWLIQTYGCEVVAFSADLGQGDELNRVEENALKTGATKVYIDDLKETFVKDYVFPAFRANAIYEGQYLLGTSLARPLIAKRQMEIARINLPLSLYTEWYWLMDLHNLFHFLKLRMDHHAQWEIREYACAIAKLTQKVVPMAYEAFERHLLNGQRFSTSEMDALHALLRGEDNPLTGYLRDEFEQKLKHGTPR